VRPAILIHSECANAVCETVPFKTFPNLPWINRTGDDSRTANQLFRAVGSCQCNFHWPKCVRPGTDFARSDEESHSLELRSGRWKTDSALQARQSRFSPSAEKSGLGATRKRGRGRRAEFVEIPISNMRKLVCARGKLFFNLWEDMLEGKVLSDDPPCGQAKLSSSTHSMMRTRAYYTSFSPLERTAMNDPTTYLWQSEYLSAILETDNALMPTRIYDALAAIEQRLLSPIETVGVEYRAIQDAQKGLLTLKAERTEASVSRSTFAFDKPDRQEAGEISN
jgi:hypothetical protein